MPKKQRTEKSIKNREQANELRKIILNLSNTKVLVLGDLMWDEYYWGNCDRVSPEAPVPIVQVHKVDRVPGGATNVLRNLTSLKVSAGIMGIVGSDQNGLEMQRELRRWNLRLTQVWESKDRPTTVKTRVIARKQQIIRLDHEETKPIKKIMQSRVLEVFAQEVNKFDALIISDYDKGFLTEDLLANVIKIAKDRKIYIAVDPQVRYFHLYRGVNLITPNEQEASDAMKMPLPQNDQFLERLGDTLKEQIEAETILITRSEKGMALFTDKKNPIYVPTAAKDVYDVTGAGDTVVSVFTATILAGADPLQATILANLAGGIVVAKFGVSTVTQRELAHALEEAY